MWMAPNVVTLVGLLFMGVAYTLSLIYTPTLTEATFRTRPYPSRA